MHPVEALLVPVGRLLRNRRPEEAASIANSPELAIGNRITLTSPAFQDGHAGSSCRARPGVRDAHRNAHDLTFRVFCLPFPAASAESEDAPFPGVVHG